MERPDNSMVDKPRYKARYQMELAIELTDMNEDTIRKFMTRNNISLSEFIKIFFAKNNNPL